MEKTTTIVVVVALVAIVGITLLILGQRGNSSPGEVFIPVNNGVSGSVTAVVSAAAVQDLAGAQFDVRYNPVVVRYDTISEGSFLDGGQTDAAMLLDTAKGEQGVLKNVILLRVKQPGVSGSGEIAVLRFTRVAAGEPGIALENVLVSDSAGNGLAAGLLSVSVS